jgi:hypothetical protein
VRAIPVVAAFQAPNAICEKPFGSAKNPSDLIVRMAPNSKSVSRERKRPIGVEMRADGRVVS